MLNYIIKKHISRRKLLANIKSKPEWKDLTKSPSIKIAIEEHKVKWDNVEKESFQPLTDSLKNEPSKYRHLVVDKRDLNKKLKSNYKKAVDLTSDVMVVKEAPIVSSNAEIVNKLNTTELQRFKKLFFVKDTTKRIIEREKSLGFNYTNESNVILDKEFTKQLNKIKDIEHNHSEFSEYMSTLKALKNSKIDDMLFLNDISDKRLTKYMLPSDHKDNKPQIEHDNFLEESLNTVGFLVESSRSLTESKYNENLVELSKEDYKRCKAIVAYEKESFELNRDIFAPKNKFSELGPQAKLFYLKQRVNTTKDVMTMSQFYIQKNMLPDMMLPFYKRIAEINIHAKSYYENPEFADIITIADPNYKSLLKRNLQALSSMNFEDFSQLYQSFKNIHKREEGKIIGNVFQKANNAMLNKFLHTVKTEREAIISSPFHLGLTIECVLELRLSLEMLLKNELGINMLIELINEIELGGNIKNMSTNTRIFNFLSQLYVERPETINLPDLVRKYELVFEKNIGTLLNPSNFESVFDNICKIAPLMTKTQILLLNLRLKDSVLSQLKENLSMNNLTALSTYMVNFSVPDFQLYHFIRKNTFNLFDDSNTVSVADTLRLLNNSGYMEIINFHKDFFNNSENNSFISTLHFKLIFNL